MALQKQTIPVTFAKGYDQKTDPLQIPIGNFEELKNSVFDTYKRLTKRNGFPALPSLPDENSSFVTTFNTNLVAVGRGLTSLCDPTNSWLDSLSYTALNLSVVSAARSILNFTQTDSATSSNGLTCVVSTSTVDYETYGYTYQVVDAVTGQSVIALTAIPGAIGTPRVFVLGRYFIVVFTINVSATPHLKYIAINTNSLSVGSVTDITGSYLPASSVSWDGVVANSTLYLAWNGAAASGIKMTYIDSTLTQHGTVIVDAGAVATVVGVGVDLTLTTPVIWVSYNDTTVEYALAVNQILGIVRAPVVLGGAGVAMLNTTPIAQDGLCTVYTEYLSTIGFDTDIEYNYVFAHKVLQAGAVVTITIASPGVVTTAGAHGLSVGDRIVFGTTGALPTGLTAGTTYYVSAVPSSTTLKVSATSGGSNINTSGSQSGVQTYYAYSLFANSVGLASKAFIVNDEQYVSCVYSSPYQPTYFVLNSSGEVVARWAYQNGGGYLANGLPAVTVDGTSAQVSYLFKATVQAVNKSTNVAAGTQVAGVYASLGINLLSVNFGTDETCSAEAGKNLLLSGGFLWGYDGTSLTENNFFLWPELILNPDGTYHGISTDPTTTVTPTGNTTDGSYTITALSSPTGCFIGATISGTGIPAGSVITKVFATTLTISQPATATGSGITLTIAGAIDAGTYFYQFTYEYSDNQGNIFRSAPSIPVSIVATGSTSVNTIKVPYLNLTYKPFTSVKIVGYRWSDAQQTYYQFTSIQEPILNYTGFNYATINDASSDETILGNNILYTTGGVVENIGPPAFKAIALSQGRLFGVVAENRDLLYLSKPIIQGTPVEMSDYLTYYVGPSLGALGPTGPMQCLAPMDDKICLFKAAAIEYLVGQGPDVTGSNSDFPVSPTFVTSTVGCTNQNSIIFCPLGILFEFQSDAGNQIWLLGRDLSTKFIGDRVETFTTDASVLSAVAIPGTNQVRFTLDSGITLMYDHYFDQWGTFYGIPGISSTLYQGQHTYINSSGAVFQEEQGTYLDGNNPTLQGIKTGWISAAGLQGYKRAYWAFLLGQYASPHKLLVGVAYNYNPAIVQQFIISPDNFSAAYGGDDTYGSGSLFGGSSAIEQWQLNFQYPQCQSFQLTITEIYDSSKGVAAGAGLTLSGLNLVVGLKKGYPKNLPATRKVG